MDWAKTTAKRDEKHLIFSFSDPYIRGLVVLICISTFYLLISYADALTPNCNCYRRAQWWLQRWPWLYFKIPLGICDFDCNSLHNDDVIKWKHFPRYWPFVQGIHRSPVNFPHKGQWRGALMFSLICVWINAWVNNCEAGNLRRHLAHDDVIVMRYQ